MICNGSAYLTDYICCVQYLNKMEDKQTDGGIPEEVLTNNENANSEFAVEYTSDCIKCSSEVEQLSIKQTTNPEGKALENKLFICLCDELSNHDKLPNS